MLKSTIARDYVKTLSLCTRQEIVKDYLSFEEQGFTGESALRKHAVELCKMQGKPFSVIDMNMLAFTVYELSYHESHKD